MLWLSQPKQPPLGQMRSEEPCAMAGRIHLCRHTGSDRGRFQNRHLDNFFQAPNVIGNTRLMFKIRVHQFRAAESAVDIHSG